MDDGQTEIIGRHWLIRELLEAGLEVALPERDRGVDLIAYSELDGSGRFVAKPIQLKSANDCSFAVDQKYEPSQELLIAYVWHVADPEKTCCYCLTYSEAEGVAQRLRWTETNSWKEGHNYTTQHPSRELVGILEPFLMDSTKWSQKVGISLASGPRPRDEAAEAVPK